MKNLRIDCISKSYGVKALLEEAQLLVNEGDHVGLVGKNGTGKSTFFDILAGKQEADDLKMDHPNDYRIELLDQDKHFPSDWTLREAMLREGNPHKELIDQYEKTLEAMTAHPENKKLQEAFAKAQLEMTHADAWTYEAQLKSAIEQLGLPDWSEKVGNLSGGQQKRLAIASVLFSQADLLLLDEPTNHLDLRAITWLENYLKQYSGSFILITHDRYFLDSVVKDIVELDQGKFRRYSGNYEDYLKKRAQRLEEEALELHKKEQAYKNELAWMRTGAKARSTKQEARIKRFYHLEKEIKDKNQADDLAIEAKHQRLGKRGLSLENISLYRDEYKIVEGLTAYWQKGQRVAIVGPNGVGKTSFLEGLVGNLPFIAGNYQIGDTVRMTYYQQLTEDLPEDQTIIDYMTQVGLKNDLSNEQLSSIPQLLESFLFPRSMQRLAIGRLSGGEKRRLYLLSHLTKEPNVLLLDEPTNDLDLETLTILTDYFREFPGLLIFVSHDRYFIDQLATDILYIQGNGDFLLTKRSLAELEGELLQRQAPSEKSSSDADVKIQEGQKKTVKKKLSYHEEKEWATIEDRISEAEERLAEIKSEMPTDMSDYLALNAWQEACDKAQGHLDDLMDRWEYLAEKR